MFPVPTAEQMSVWIFILAQAAKWTVFHCTCCMNFLWCFCHFLSAMPVKSPWSSAASPNLLLLFIFIVSVVSIRSWRLIQYWVILEVGSYADDKPLTLIKYSMPSWLRFTTYLFIKKGGKNKRKELGGIKVFRVFFLFISQGDGQSAEDIRDSWKPSTFELFVMDYSVL